MHEQFPEELFGKKHLAAFGKTPGFLLKYLDSSIRLQQLCEAFAVLKKAAATPTSEDLPSSAYDDSTFMDELLAYGKYDTDALAIRLNRFTFYGDIENSVDCVDVETKTNRFAFLFSKDTALLKQCAFYEEMGRLCALSPERKAELLAYCRQAAEHACQTVTVFRRGRDGVISLVGIVSRRETVQRELSDTLRAFSECGVRLSFFLYGDSDYELAFADVCGIEGKRVVRSESAPSITDALLEEYRVFVGYPREEIQNALRILQKKRRCVGVFAGSAEDRLLLNDAAFLAVNDPTYYHEKDAAEEIRKENLDVGDENSLRACSVMRRHSDVIVQRASEEGGGLSALLQALLECRAVAVKIRLLLSYLVPTQTLRIFAAIMGALFGFGLPGGALMLYATVLIDAVALTSVLSLKIPKTNLTKSSRVNEGDIEQLVFQKSRWVPMLISLFLVSLYLAIFMWFGIISVGEIHTYLFFSILSLEILLLYTVIFKKSFASKRPWFCQPAVFMTVPILAVTFLSVLFPSLGVMTGLGAWSIVTLLTLPLFPLFYFLSVYFLSFFSRTAKRT